MRANEITSVLVRSLLDYNQETGTLIWKVRTPDHFSGKRPAAACAAWNARFANRIAGRPGTSGHLKITLLGRPHLTHRLIYLMMTGRWPDHQVDHINLNPQDNRWCNLRPATPSQNIANSGISRRNRSGAKGVRCVKRKSGIRWRADIIKNGTTISLGVFATRDEARFAYAQAASHHFGSFARTSGLSTSPDRRRST
jgi:hypothetical protein